MRLVLKVMKTSISEVMETMFFLPVEFLEEPSLKDIKGIKGKQNKVCCLDFSGDRSGSVYLLIPTGLLSQMAENFMGEPAESLTDDLLNGTLTETVNMITGNALRKVKTEKPFSIGIPKMVPGSEFPETEGTLMVNTPGLKMAVHITLK